MNGGALPNSGRRVYPQRDWILALWLVTGMLWDIAVFAACGYLVFWRNRRERKRR